MSIIVFAVFVFTQKKEEANAENIAIAAIICIWISQYPMAFYTCYRLISEGDRKGSILEDLITCGNGISLFVIPLFLSPFLIIDYIKCFRIDMETAKRQKKYDNCFK